MRADVRVCVRETESPPQSAHEFSFVPHDRIEHYSLGCDIGGFPAVARADVVFVCYGFIDDVIFSLMLLFVAFIILVVISVFVVLVVAVVVVVDIVIVAVVLTIVGPLPICVCLVL